MDGSMKPKRALDNETPDWDWPIAVTWIAAPVAIACVCHLLNFF